MGRGPSRDDPSGITEFVEKCASRRIRVVGIGNIWTWGVGISCGLKYNRRALTGDGGNSSAAVLVALERNASTSNKEKETSNSSSCCRF